MLSKVTRKIQFKLGLTKSEAGVIIFLAAGLIIGGTAKILKLDKATEHYDFRQSDQFFETASSKIDSIIAAEEDTLKYPAKSGSKAKTSISSSLDLNKADLNGLASLPGIGKSLAQRIIDYRNSVTKFTSIEELRKVKGIGPKKFEKMKSFVRIN
ncbi:MAG TPA: helix-hairpin-helix domain-containing protein [Candidatus Acidoferrales bacterium]|nr:helix-hairpin-helix domain-containing protein [Candidatus Acidoferrales bacterium]